MTSLRLRNGLGRKVLAEARATNWFRLEAEEDHRVGDEVANALYWDLALPRDRVEARCNDGWVTLTGEVERAYQRSSAEADVMRVHGVRGVVNAITVAATTL